MYIIPANTKCRSSRPEVFLGKVVLKICSKFTGERPCRSVISIKLQSKEHLWMAASAHIQIQIIILHVPKVLCSHSYRPSLKYYFKFSFKKHLKYAFIFLNIYFVAISFVWIITNRITEVLLR